MESDWVTFSPDTQNLINTPTPLTQTLHTHSNNNSSKNTPAYVFSEDTNGHNTPHTDDKMMFNEHEQDFLKHFTNSNPTTDHEWSTLENIDFLNPNNHHNNGPAHTTPTHNETNEPDNEMKNNDHHPHHAMDLNLDFNYMEMNYPPQNGAANHNNSSAFPPSSNSIIPPTPNSLELISHTNTFFQSPVLLSQSSKLNNIPTSNPGYQPKNQAQQPQQHVRPDVIFTPLVSPAVTPLDTIENKNLPNQATFFSPLTSPALEAKKRPSPEDINRNSLNGKTSKRKTPHSTPLMSATTKTGRIIKSSPVIKSRKSTSGSISYDLKLPDATMEVKTPMLPPSIKKNNSVSSIKEEPMMNFTMGKLQQQQQNQEYPILPKTQLTQQSPILLSQYSQQPSYQINSDDDMESNKKTSHKLAEKGRRNRMNLAIQDLASLIPAHLHDEVNIPSKATTVELGCKFIKILSKQIEELKKQQGSPISEESISPLEVGK